jgi:hypothetical protein
MGAGASRTHEWQKSVAGSGTILEPAPAICLYTHVKAHFHGAGSDTIFKHAPVRWGTCTTYVKSLRQKNAALQENGR